ncbi:MAG: TIGR03862 family flavoprotein [Pseudomonadota bacterium]|nr:TIGR03862 family flavoprotein [Pseudomonadota bacterium]
MAAEVLAAGGAQVDVYDAMPSVGRKFLLAGRGGLNLSHAEATDVFLRRYGAAEAHLQPMLADFDANALRAWCTGLGVATFVGSSGRIFPQDMKAAPLLRAWLHRLRGVGVRFHMRHRWTGWDSNGALQFTHLEQAVSVRADATVLALGGASWARLGSDGAWVPTLREAAIDVADLVPANCGFETDWSPYFVERAAGQPLKSIAISWSGAAGRIERRIGECMVTAQGLEGSLIYAISSVLREQIAQSGSALIHLDLAPDRSAERVQAEVAHPRGARSLSSHLQSRVGITGVKSALLRELLAKEVFADAAQLAAAIKQLPVRLYRIRPIDEAISSAGGVRFAALDSSLMTHRQPGLFCAGEMLDWEAPTGGYLLNACMASGRHAARGALAYLAQLPEP